jgi:murein DD-endopeptidase MepM/ murein hydrolase activator NlpD
MIPDEIEQGSLIGKIGATGFANGPALHFEVIVDDEQVNPHDYMPGP